ncbi:MAG: LysR family transcriptional regulator [Betaproteobacteria bacterium SG8_41]|jgi:DNA-binding transcriptional LysR family regulator|nr:MAG: LysR family transcriptional regulator [Betaproteobacteria bacterium SG8_41]KPK69630.1 MAG: LysR family transcriptional regulator [Acidithiobacillales bacterium SM23_46]
MNWDDLRIFLAIARMGSVSGAGRHLDVQHSTVSRRLKQLEQDLGVRLLERKRSGYELTPAGEDLKVIALRMEREMLLIDGTLQGQDRQLAGSLRVTAVNIMASSFLAPIFSRFSKAYPEIKLQVLVSNSDVSLVGREADAAIRVTNAPSETLIGKKIARIASTVYGGRRYLAALRKKSAPPAWIGMTCCDFHRQWTKKLAGGESYPISVDDPNVTQQMLKQGAGLAILPCYLADPDPELERYADPVPEMDTELWFLLHRDLKRTERLRVFRDFVAQEIAEVRDLLEGSRY